MPNSHNTISCERTLDSLISQLPVSGELLESYHHAVAGKMIPSQLVTDSIETGPFLFLSHLVVETELSSGSANRPES